MTWFILGLLAPIALLAVLDWFFPLTVIHGYSMFPTYADGDIAIGRRFLFKRAVFKGDVVVIRHPERKDRLLVKRVWEASERGVFVLGDNVNNSNDSRNFGYVPVRNVVTKIIYPARGKEDVPYDYRY